MSRRVGNRPTNSIGTTAKSYPARLIPHMHTHNSLADGKFGFNHYPKLALRQWHGMSTSDWWKLAASNDFAIERLGLALGVSFFAALNSIGNRIQKGLFGRRVKDLPLVSDPIFILGHWRTGTTLLHTLMSLDDRLKAPSNLECFTPRHFLFTSWWLPYLITLPKRRPMDNMSMNWLDPQEDEYALCCKGVPSVYRNNAFPRHENQHLETLDMEGLPPEQHEAWNSALKNFVSCLNYKHRRPLVLKSPTHTGRVHKLLSLFPNAKFIHITRDPYEFIPSTIYLWKALNETNGLQNDVHEIDWEDYVFDCFQRMYAGYRRHRNSIPSRNFFELSYEQLVGEPAYHLSAIYQHLDLPRFAHVHPHVTKYFDQHRDYRRNEHLLSGRLRRRINATCAEYMQEFGYMQRTQKRAA